MTCARYRDVGIEWRATDPVERDESDVMEEERPDYRSYLLRLWRVSDDEKPAWRALLKSAHTGRQVGFGTLEELFEFLQSQTRLVAELDQTRQGE